MLGVHERRNRNTLSVGSMAAAEAAAAKERSRLEVLGEVPLVNFYNDGGRGTGTAQEMALPERANLAFEGVVVAAVVVFRSQPSGGGGGGGGTQPPRLNAKVKVTTRGMWLDKGRFLDAFNQASGGMWAAATFGWAQGGACHLAAGGGPCAAGEGDIGGRQLRPRSRAKGGRPAAPREGARERGA
jgi:hypothetical protein